MGFFSELFGLKKTENDYSKDLDGYYDLSNEKSVSPNPKKQKNWFSRLAAIIIPPKDFYHSQLAMRPAFAWFLVKGIAAGERYREKAIAREGKPPRIISIPDPVLKNVQRRILSRILNNIKINNAAHGFIKQRSIFSAMAPHAGKRIVVVLDIRDFFGTITAKRVFGMFRSNGFETRESAVLTKLSCYQDKLPQGAPTSPMIANIICRKLDSRLQGLTSKKGYSYTRYADDLIFSGDERLLRLLPLIRQIITEEGFGTAEEKFRIMRSGSRQQALGLNVNTIVSIPRKVRRLVRAMVHRQLQTETLDESMMDFLYGHVGLMASAHPSQSRKLKRKLNKIRKRLG